MSGGGGGHPPHAGVPDFGERSRAWRLDEHRRLALEELTSELIALIEHAHQLTAATLNTDVDGVRAALAGLVGVAANPKLELARITEIYNGLRLSIIRHQPVSDGGQDMASTATVVGAGDAAQLAQPRPLATIRWPFPPVAISPAGTATPP